MNVEKPHEGWRTPVDRGAGEDCPTPDHHHPTAWQAGVAGAKTLGIAVLLCLVCVGCVSSRSVATHVLRAPNQQVKDPKLLKHLVTILATNFPARRIVVGPPQATLEVLVLEPGDYEATCESTFMARPRKRGGDHSPYSLDFKFSFPRFSPKSRLGMSAVRGTIFVLHGYGLKKELMMPWGMLLAKAGYRVVLVDLRGHGRSTGDRIYFGSVERTDMAECLDLLVRQGICREPVGVLGVSYGAVVALQWASVDPRVRCVAAISPYSDPSTAVEQFLRTYVPRLSPTTDRKVAERVGVRLAAECPDLATETAIRRINRPILFVRGERDELCGREDLRRFRATAPEGSEVQEVPLANHLVVGMCVTQLGSRVTEWFHSGLDR